MVSKSEFVRARLLGRVGKSLMLLGLFAIVMGVMPLMTGRFPTRQESSERMTTLLWLLPLVFVVEMCAAAVWYSHEYDRRWEKGRHVACSLADSQNEIAGNLRRLTTEGLEGSFMVVSVGKAYVQFAGDKSAKHLRFEAVSNEYLPAKMRLTEDKISELVALGFDVSNPKPNYSREVDTSRESAIQVIAKTARDILINIYGCGPKSKPRIELVLGKH